MNMPYRITQLQWVVLAHCAHNRGEESLISTSMLAREKTGHLYSILNKIRLHELTQEIMHRRGSLKKRHKNRVVPAPEKPIAGVIIKRLGTDYNFNCTNALYTNLKANTSEVKMQRSNGKRMKSTAQISYIGDHWRCTFLRGKNGYYGCIVESQVNVFH